MTIKDSLAFPNYETENCEARFRIFYESLDVVSHFANIPLKETIDICTDILFENTEKVEGLSKIEFRELLSLATKEFYCIFNGKFYKQTDGVVMGLPLVPTLANGFLLYNLNKTDYKIAHLTLSLITTGALLMISFFHSPQQKI